MWFCCKILTRDRVECIPSRRGHFQFKELCFGLTNAPSTFQAVMNRVLEPFLDKFVTVYMDEILVYSADLAHHAEPCAAGLAALG